MKYFGNMCMHICCRKVWFLKIKCYFVLNKSCTSLTLNMGPVSATRQARISSSLSCSITRASLDVTMDTSSIILPRFTAAGLRPLSDSKQLEHRASRRIQLQITFETTWRREVSSETSSVSSQRRKLSPAEDEQETSGWNPSYPEENKLFVVWRCATDLTSHKWRYVCVYWWFGIDQFQQSWHATWEKKLWTHPQVHLTFWISSPVCFHTEKPVSKLQ